MLLVLYLLGAILSWSVYGYYLKEDQEPDMMFFMVATLWPIFFVLLLIIYSGSFLVGIGRAVRLFKEQNYD